jgi:serine/threonine protein kinase
METCPNCGRVSKNDTVYCENCGAMLPQLAPIAHDEKPASSSYIPPVICSICNSENEPDSARCYYCDSVLAEHDTVVSKIDSPLPATYGEIVSQHEDAEQKTAAGTKPVSVTSIPLYDQNAGEPPPEITEGGKICSQCGTLVPPTAMRCDYCGMPTWESEPSGINYSSLSFQNPRGRKLLRWRYLLVASIRDHRPDVIRKRDKGMTRYLAIDIFWPFKRPVTAKNGITGSLVQDLKQDLRRWWRNRLVLVKELQLDSLVLSEQEDAIGRLKNESEILAQLNHINLPTALDFFTNRRRVYLVIEYARGPSLQMVVDALGDKLFLSDNEVIEWIYQLCEILSYLHRNHCVFRDIGPDQVVIFPGGKARLVDFGIARVAKEKRRHDTRPLGTPGYASPEQYGIAQTDERSDIYSLGVTMREILTKKDPPKGPSELRQLHDSSPMISPVFKEVIQKATRVQPSDRFQSVEEMWNTLANNFTNYNWQTWHELVRRILRSNTRVRPEQLANIPISLRPYALIRYAEQHREQDVSWFSDASSMWLNRASEWQAFNKPWVQLRRSFEEQKATHGLLSVLRQMLKLGRQNTVDKLIATLQATISIQCTQKADKGHLSVYYWDMGVILSEVNIASILPLVVLKTPALTTPDLEDLRWILSTGYQGPNRIVVLLLFTDAEGVEKTRQALDKLHFVHAWDVVILSHDEVFGIVTAKNPPQAFRSAVLSQVDLTTVSPFVTRGPALARIFFGREQELQTIIERASSSSFAVIGGRRIGKTSLLNRLHQVRLPTAGVRSVFYDCTTMSDIREFLDASIKNWNPEPPSPPIVTFDELLKSPPTDKPLVLLLDEADSLIVRDKLNDWRLINRLRALANTGQAQVVFSGERMLREALRDPESPLFNFAKELRLGPLDYNAAEELIARPMEQLEIRLINVTSIVQRIYDFTAGHPNVIQMVCHRLIESLKVQNRRYITLDDVKTVIDDPIFLEEDFLNTYWERSTPLERIITVIIAKAEVDTFIDTQMISGQEYGFTYDEHIIELRKSPSILMNRKPRAFSLNEILRLLEAQGLRPAQATVEAALARLTDLRSILRLGQHGCEFAVRSFPWALLSVASFEDQMISLITQYQQDSMEAN